ncbi:MAG: hypothetical protein JXR52_01625 [Bacteroidales bacterium]|nr:hypothetical protein [Bacteroidales bacterium]
MKRPFKPFLSKILFSGLFILISLNTFTQETLTLLRNGFSNPPDSSRPLTWWHWTMGNVTKEGITKDLEWMKRSGIAGFQLADVAFGMGQKVEDPVFFGYPEWLNAIGHAAQEAKRLGLEMGIFSSPGWSLTGGPWVKPEQAMKKLVWSKTTVDGPSLFNGSLPKPPANNGPIRDMQRSSRPDTIANPIYYRDQRIIAFPIPPDEQVYSKHQPVVTTHSGNLDGNPLLDDNLNTALKISPPADSGPLWIQFTYEMPVTVRSFSIASREGIPEGRLLAGDDGQAFRTIVSLPGTQNYRSGKVRTYTFPGTTARCFRLEITRAAPSPAGVMSQTLLKYPDAVTLTECILHQGSRVHRWEDKAGFSILFEYGSSPTPEAPGTSVISAQQVTDLTGRMDENGVLSWDVPEGSWTIMRFGYSLTGAKNRPAVPAGTGYEVDKLNEEHTAAYIEAYLKALEQSEGSLQDTPLQHLLLDSWEAGMQNWTDDMAEEFATRRGYDPLPWLPALSGYVVESAEMSDRFLWDFRRTLADMFAENHYGTITGIAHEKGLRTYGEASGVSLEVMEDALLNKKQVDVPMGEFWVWDLHPGIMYRVDVRGAASAAHVYGKKIAAAEAFTGGGYESPFRLKQIGDYWFTQGINRFVFHTSAHQPLDTRPGNTMVGTHLHRNITWAEQAKPFMDYIARTSFMLQQGHSVADLVYLLDEGAPSTMPFWGGGLRPPVPEGYDYDYINADALINLMDVNERGQLVLPGGASYRILVLPGSPRMTLPLLRKIRELVIGGAVILGPKVTASPGLAGYPESEQEIHELSEALWGDLDGNGRTVRYAGKGLVAWGEPLPALLERIGVQEDVNYDRKLNAEFSWIHRKMDDTDIYFISNRSDTEQNVTFRFRVNHKQAECWHPGEGTMEPVSFRNENGSTTVPLHFPEYGSVFVVFSNSASPDERFLSVPEEHILTEIEGPWELTFLPGPGNPGPLTLDRLVSWAELSDPFMKYFSGSATYSKTFRVSAKRLKEGKNITIDLGEVRDMAEIKLNGKALPLLWKEPYRTDITSFVKKGTNTLEITVTNQWTNRLAGDAILPENERMLDTFIGSFMGVYRAEPSGLLGPVKLISFKNQ